MATLEQVEQALRAADAAGNTEDARRLAQAYVQMRESQGAPKIDAKPSLFRMDSDFDEKSGVGIGTMLMAAARDMFGSRESAAKYLVDKINEEKGLSSLITGGAKVVQGAEGEPMVRLADGTTYRVNDDGIDSADIANVAGNVGAFFLPASWAAKLGKARNAGLAGRAGLQSLAAAGTDVALQAGFNDQIDPVRTAATAAGGVGGEVFGTGLALLGRKAGQASRAASGANQRSALAMLGGAGIKPAPEKVNRLAPAMEQVRIGADPRAILGGDEFGFVYTQGQRLAESSPRKFDQLAREELLRQSPGGANAFRQAAEHNAGQLDSALAGISQRLGGRAATTPVEMVQGSASRLREQADELGSRISEAYKKAGESNGAAISSDVVRSMAQRLQSAVRDFAPNPATTPATSKTLEQIQRATEGVLSGNVRGVTLRALETQRRILNNNINAAANKADRAAMIALKREFDGWLDEAVDTALVSGDPSALTVLKEARGLRAEFARRFEGGADSDRFIAGLLDGSRTPEELVNIALGASQVSKSGGARFIERLRKSANDDPEVMNGLRAAHFDRLTRSNTGEALDPGKILGNIKRTEYSNASVLKALYSPEEWGQIRRLANALEPLVARGDFAKTSGTTERMMRMLFQRVGGNLPVVGEMLQGIGSVRNTVQANRAVNAPLRAPVRSSPAAPSGLSGMAAEVAGN